MTGDNGILNQTDKAKTGTTIGEENEAIGLAYSGAMLETKGESVTADGIDSEFCKNGTKATATPSTEGIRVDFIDTGRRYMVDAYGKIYDSGENENIGEITLGVVNDLKVGDYVNHPDKNRNKILCKVLYNNENYEVQLVSVNPVGTVTLGYNDPNDTKGHGTGECF